MIESNVNFHYPHVQNEQLEWKLIDIVIRNRDDITIRDSDIGDGVVLILKSYEQEYLHFLKEYSKMMSNPNNIKKVNNKKKKPLTVTIIVAIDKYDNEYKVGGCINDTRYDPDTYIRKYERILNRYGLEISTKTEIWTDYI